MAEFPALPLWTDAYLGDTTHLTTIEHGAYLLLLIVAWRTADCDLPDDDRLLARYARLDARQWKRMKPILAEFFVIEDGRWKQLRLLDEREAVRTYREKQSEKGKKGAEAKALKNKGRHKAPAKSGCDAAGAQVQPDASSLLHTQEVKTEPKGSSKRSRLSEDWKPDPFGEGTQSRKIVDAWTPEEAARQLEAFRAHHIGNETKWADWQKAWSTWVLNSVNFRRSSGFDRANGSGQRNHEDIVLEEIARRAPPSATGAG